MSDFCFPMSQARAGSNVVIDRFEGLADESLRIREMGLFEGQRVRVVHSSDPLICQIEYARVGLARRLAHRIFVRNCMA
jgi:Fe2+ transport system protein FeoA